MNSLEEKLVTERHLSYTDLCQLEENEELTDRLLIKAIETNNREMIKPIYHRYHESIPLKRVVELAASVKGCCISLFVYICETINRIEPNSIDNEKLKSIIYGSGNFQLLDVIAD